MYWRVFCELSEIGQTEFIVESCKIERIFGVTPCHRKFVLLPTSERELMLLNIFLNENYKNNVCIWHKVTLVDLKRWSWITRGASHWLTGFGTNPQVKLNLTYWDRASLFTTSMRFSGSWLPSLNKSFTYIKSEIGCSNTLLLRWHKAGMLKLTKNNDISLFSFNIEYTCPRQYNCFPKTLTVPFCHLKNWPKTSIFSVLRIVT